MILAHKYNVRGEDFGNAGEVKKRKVVEKRQSRAEARKKREEFLNRQARLEEELKSLYPIPRRIKRDSENCLD